MSAKTYTLLQLASAIAVHLSLNNVRVADHRIPRRQTKSWIGIVDTPKRGKQESGHGLNSLPKSNSLERLALRGRVVEPRFLLRRKPPCGGRHKGSVRP